jgi:nucleotide-binding universal stress UspA family protein
MIRSILLPFAETPLNASTRECAFWLARQCRASIHALAVIDVKSFEIPVIGTPDGFMPAVVTPPVQENQALLEEMTATAKERLNQFADQAASRSIPCSTDCKTGIIGDVIAHESVAHDIVVLSRSGYTRVPGAETKVDGVVHQVLRGAIRPILVVGAEFKEDAGELHMMVAYDGSGHAGRALEVAAELGARPGIRCTLLNIATSKESGAETLALAEAYLYHHGLTPGKEVALGSKPAEVICELASSSRADILVMGAYGHRPVREMLFGSTTERVLAHCGATLILQS